MRLKPGMKIKHRLTGRLCKIVDVRPTTVILQQNEKLIPVSINSIRAAYDVPQDHFKWAKNPLWLIGLIILAGFMFGFTM